LIWNPLFIFNVGFWLSHLAVAGIVAFYPLINSIFSFKFVLWRWFWSIISVSVAAQITTIPFSLWMFGTFPTYFLLTNIILIPVVGPVLITSFIILMVSWIPVVPIVLGAFLNDLVGFMEGVVNYIESLPNSYITNIWVSWPLTMTMFLLIFFWYQNYQNPKPRLMLKTAFLLSLVMIIINIQWFIKSSSNKFIVFDAGQQFFVEVVNNGRSVAFSSTGIEDFQQIFISGGFEKRYVNRINDLYFLNDVSGNQPPETYRISCGNKTYCLLIGGKGSLVADLTHKVDVLVISGKPNINLSELVKWLKCDTIVFASNCPPWKVGKWRNQLAHLNVFIHDVRSMGAYIDSY
jgi:competence protein ComEC